MTITTTSKRYAKALILNAIDQGKLDMLFEEILYFSSILEDSEELKDFISNPTISKDLKKSLLNDITGNSLPNISVLFNLLTVKNRIDIILSVCSSFVKLYYNHKNIVEVTVTTPVEISDEVELSIKKYISSIKKGEVKLTKKKDESLIAGFTLDFDNTRLDASIKKRISMMKKQLKTN
tara:strand:- start:17 stop:553 length:537 start_codon:yes stop_codon:yes gene_type:complete